MTGKYTKADIKGLAREIIRAKDECERPFNFLTGAGCSLSGGIPLARDFVKEINAKFEHRCLKLLSEEERKDYGHCMSVVPKNDRKRLLSSYLDKAQVNWGHLAIAAMMEAGYIGRVLTFNFDSILARSCGLLGIYPATYDFASGVTSGVHHITDRAIIHLHGQGHGIALLNTGDETEKHAKNLRPLIHETLNKNPLLVIGYSGLSDAVFPILKQEYDANEGLIWVGHREAPNTTIQELLDKGGRSADFLGGADSDKFLVELAREIGCWPPKLFTNPYEHLLDELRPVILGEDSETAPVLTGLRERLTKDSENLQNDDTPEFTKLYMDAEWGAVIAAIGNPKTEREAESLFWAYMGQGNEILALAKFKQDEGLFEGAFEKYKAALTVKPYDYRPLCNWGIALADLAQLKQDEALFEASVEKFDAALAIKPDDCKTLFCLGGALLNFARLTQDEEFLEQARERLEHARVANPDELYNFACLHAVLGDFKKCKEMLFHCKEKNTLPSIEHLKMDEDLEKVRKLDWFAEILETETA